ncbi:DUF742 domain-containing protein [Streptomyces sp. NBC_00525]|uniref:DUF742 domain-containing protein n=1 Tax=Streptomyces sp. NBC_00525 TaxID=2903660 RepID=UPI002E81327F|nr:DUF742 domain-containing protein [Streptomyces sp. NBC_00525]WUC96483.1 DUF742 domain-containing protein [Streptomyces sp. NBC_00525]
MIGRWPYREGDEFDDGEDGAGTMVRPYTITRGRTAPERDDLTLITVLTTAHDPRDAHGAAARPGRLQPEHRMILDRCRHPAAVAEVAAGLDLPVSVTKILLADLVATGLLIARAPLSVARASGGADMSVLAAVRDGLRRL